jgi:membrane protease YdiL (CAAX protease family)
LWRHRDWRGWGFRTDNLGDAARPLMLMSLAGLMALGPVRLPNSSALVFLIYPLWGLVQQFALQVLVARNLQTLGIPAVLAGLLFGAAHLPDLPLAGLTALGGVLWCAVYARAPNLWALGLCHAWLGALAYYGVLHRDPWGEMFVTP